MISFNHSSETKRIYNDAIIKLVQSIVETELSLTELVNQETAKINFLIKDHFSNSNSNPQHTVDFLKSQSMIMNTILMKEWLLASKLDLLIQKNAVSDHSKDAIPSEEHVWNDVNFDEEE
jgi:hypothetical protein